MDLLEERKKGVLPQIEIAGHYYTVDIRLNELREAEVPYRKLGLDEMVTAQDGRHYLFFYHPENRAILHATPDMVKIPENVVLVQIPDELGLDPVGMARKYGLGDEYFLKMHPYEHDVKAKVIPLEKSGLPEFVASNRKQVKQHQLKSGQRN